MMEIQSVSPLEYGNLFPAPSHVYNSVSFNELNRSKCASVLYLVFKDERGKVRLGIILGDTGDELKSPFSAPFGGFEERGEQKLCYYFDAAQALKLYAADASRRLTIVLPPPIYNRCSHIAKQQGALQTCGFTPVYSEYNYSFPAGIFRKLLSKMRPEARNKLRISQSNSLNLEIIDSSDEENVRRAYGIIKENRDFKNYPLRMSLADVFATVKLVNTDFFLLTCEGEDVAAAMIYHVTDGIVQVIYWGDRPGYSHLRPMNYFAYRLVEYYDAYGMTVDVGPSSSEGIPSLGLCDFKESIGCDLSLKPVFSYKP